MKEFKFNGCFINRCHNVRPKNALSDFKIMMYNVSPIFILLVSSSMVFSQDPVVETTTGTVKGYRVSSNTGISVDTFLGIPYAEPPIGDKRFKHPEKVKPWKGVFDATKKPLTCFQKRLPLQGVLRELNIMLPHTKHNEDCLKLNVFVPRTNKKELLPVMVWIHGGGYAIGGISSEIYNSTTLASEENVMVVMMNYRVASIGFLFLDHPEVPGNAGLYDQLLALEWIKENAKAFGGDPDSITLFGQSAGASSVGHHLLSPLSAGLFHRAIMSSASPSSDILVYTRDEALSAAAILLDNLGCPRDNITETIQCLRSADPSDLLSSEKHRGYSYIFNYMPVVDGNIVPDKPRDLLLQGRFSKVNLMTGSVKDESSYFLTMINPAAYPMSDKVHVTMSDGRRLMDFYKFKPVTKKLIEFLYGGDMHLPDNEIISIQEVVKVSSDYVFICPIRDFEQAYSRSGNKVYKYYLPHRASVVKTPLWQGTYHSQDIVYYFGEPLRPGNNYTGEEKTLSRRIMRYWANFARYGEPNEPPSNKDSVAVHWPEYTSDGKEYLVLAPNSSSVGKGLLETKCLFWRDLKFELLNIVKSEANKTYAPAEPQKIKYI